MKKIVSKILASIAVIAFSLTNTSCSNDSSQDLKVTDSKVTEMTLEEAENQQNTNLKAANVYTIKKYIFNRSAGANGLGHVGVAFELKATINGVNYTSFYTGSVEGSSLYGIPLPYISPGSNNGGWGGAAYQYSTQPQMLARFRSLGYNSYKFGGAFVSTTQAISNNSKAILAAFPGRGYNVAGNNCMDAAYQVITSFSGNNGNPSVPSQFFPNNWYNALTVSLGWSNAVAL